MTELHLGDCLEFMKTMDDECVDLTVTSPPYDNLREYNKRSDWNKSIWMTLIKNLYRITKNDGVVVWIVADATIGGSETGTSFKQALWAMECGFKLHDTMIWNKGGFSAVGSLSVRYAPVFDYMFVFSKKNVTFNPIKDRKTKHGGKTTSGTIRNTDGTTKAMSKKMVINEYGQRYNIWNIPPQRQRGEDAHPAPFPLQLAKDHIKSWSNEGDTVFDPFMGSGTTGVACAQLGRNFIGCEIDPEYFAIAEKRIKKAEQQMRLI